MTILEPLKTPITVEATTNRKRKRDHIIESAQLGLRRKTQMSSPLLTQRLFIKVQEPKRMTSGFAGYDLHSSEETVIAPPGRQLVATGIAITVPAGTYGRIAPRSGMSVKHSIDVGAGVVDEDYTGEVKVVLINRSDKDYRIRTGDRIAQLILEQIKTPETKMATEIKPTIRGNTGFGSTGISTRLVTIDSNDITSKVSNQSETKTYSYNDAVKQLGYDPIKEYPDVFPEK